MPAIKNLDTLLAHLQPMLHAGRYAFATIPPDRKIDPALLVASVREPDGLSVVVEESDARALGLPMVFTAAWITLRVHSDLEAVGLTAAIAQALAQAGISCNVLAGVRHDHLFVPVARAQAAIDVLCELQRRARRRLAPEEDSGRSSGSARPS